MGLTERICEIAARSFSGGRDQDLSAQWRAFKQEEEEKKMQAVSENLADMKHIGDDIYLDYSKKLVEDTCCVACGEDDKTKAGEDSVYSLTGNNFEAIVLCSRHMAELAEQVLLHVVRVSKGLEAGGIKLPLRRWVGEDDK